MDNIHAIVHDKRGARAMRQGNRPDRRISDANSVSATERASLAQKLIYVGSALHKHRPGDYGFRPPVNPRPSKSLCDGRRTILLNEANELLKTGVSMGMFSNFNGDGLPKYIWCVGSDGEVYEAKIGIDGYHGYVLGDEDDMRNVVLKEWKKRSNAGQISNHD